MSAGGIGPVVPASAEAAAREKLEQIIRACFLKTVEVILHARIVPFSADLRRGKINRTVRAWPSSRAWPTTAPTPAPTPTGRSARQRVRFTHPCEASHVSPDPPRPACVRQPVLCTLTHAPSRTPLTSRFRCASLTLSSTSLRPCAASSVAGTRAVLYLSSSTSFSTSIAALPWLRRSERSASQRQSSKCEGRGARARRASFYSSAGRCFICRRRRGARARPTPLCWPLMPHLWWLQLAPTHSGSGGCLPLLLLLLLWLALLRVCGAHALPWECAA